MSFDVFLNRKLASVNSSPTLKLTSLAKKLKKEGKDVINFAAGEPDFDTPHFIKEAAKKALDEGYTKYTPSAGLIELRETIAQKLKEENNLNYSFDNIIVTSGAKYAVFLAIFSLVNSKEEVIIPSPYWVSYPEIVKLAGGKIKILSTEKKENFKINPDKLKNLLTSNTKVLILNYPANPTGVTYTEEEIRNLWDVIRGANLIVVSDEIYEKIIFDEMTHTSFASLEGAFERTLTINGFSKSFSMTGWRLGYIAGPKEIIGEIKKVIDHTTSCANAVTQKSAVAALKSGENWYREIRSVFQERRDLIYQELKACQNILPLKPSGTFYIFCDIQNTGLSAFEFSSRLLQEYLVAVIPSEGFGIDGYIRISFSTSKECIIEGVRRIREFLDHI